MMEREKEVSCQQSSKNGWQQKQLSKSSNGSNDGIKGRYDITSKNLLTMHLTKRSLSKNKKNVQQMLV